MLNSSLIGRVLPSRTPHLPKGDAGTITIVGITLDEGFLNQGTTICAELKWDTGSPILDEGTTIGSIAPGTAIWRELEIAGPVEQS